MEKNEELKQWIATVITNYSHVLSFDIAQEGARLVNHNDEYFEMIMKSKVDKYGNSINP